MPDVKPTPAAAPDCEPVALATLRHAKLSSGTARSALPPLHRRPVAADELCLAIPAAEHAREPPQRGTAPTSVRLSKHRGHARVLRGAGQRATHRAAVLCALLTSPFAWAHDWGRLSNAVWDGSLCPHRAPFWCGWREHFQRDQTLWRKLHSKRSSQVAFDCTSAIHSKLRADCYCTRTRHFPRA